MLIIRITCWMSFRVLSNENTSLKLETEARKNIFFQKPLQLRLDD